nr:MAG TPA: hypothetical protein [Caudoviricetes sp.]
MIGAFCPLNCWISPIGFCPARAKFASCMMGLCVIISNGEDIVILLSLQRQRALKSSSATFPVHPADVQGRCTAQ